MICALLSGDAYAKWFVGILGCNGRLVPALSLLTLDVSFHIPASTLSFTEISLLQVLRCRSILFGGTAVFFSRSRRVLRPRRLCDGHVSDAAD